MTTTQHESNLQRINALQFSKLQGEAIVREELRFQGLVKSDKKKAKLI